MSGGEVWSRQQWWRYLLLKRQVVISGRRITNIQNALLARLPLRLQLRFLPFLQSLIASWWKVWQMQFYRRWSSLSDEPWESPSESWEETGKILNRRKWAPWPVSASEPEIALAWHNHSTSTWSWKVCRWHNDYVVLCVRTSNPLSASLISTVRILSISFTNWGDRFHLRSIYCTPREVMNEETAYYYAGMYLPQLTFSGQGLSSKRQPESSMLTAMSDTSLRTPSTIFPHGTYPSGRRRAVSFLTKT